MTHLIPEQRVDKNGNLVTRHVKQDAGSRIQAGSIPAPSLAKTVESPAEVIRREFLSYGFSEHEANVYIGYSANLGHETQKVVAEALLNRTEDEDVANVKHIITVAMDPGVVQLAVSDLDFFRKIKECFPSGERMSQQRAAFNVFESTFRNNFKTATFADNIKDFDYLRYAPPFRAEVVSSILQIKGNASTTFEEREQEDHIKDNIDEFVDNIIEHHSVALTTRDYGINLSSRDILGISNMIKEYGSTVEVITMAIVDRKRYDEDEIRSILSTAPALSQGAI